MRWFFPSTLIRQPDGRWRWRKRRLWFHLGNSSNYKGPCIRLCLCNFCFFFFFFGVGLGAVLVVHIFDGFPDKKLVRRDLKFFAKFTNGGTVKRSSICRFFISFESAKIRPHRLPFSAVEEGHSSEKQDGVRGIRRSRGRENLPFER